MTGGFRAGDRSPETSLTPDTWEDGGMGRAVILTGSLIVGLLSPTGALPGAASPGSPAGAERAGREMWPGASWTRQPPARLGLDRARLEALAKFAGGDGCVVRRGYLAFTWGDVSRRRDVASACKPWYTHFLFRALEQGKIPDLDERVVRWEPRLGEINAALGHKDRAITWRHLANQIACYGLVEKPGTAYAYNDWQMALFFDTLFQKVYGVPHRQIDEKVFRPLLTDILQCEDGPTCMAYGPGDRPGRVAVSVRDFARFGLLYLRGGRWKDHRLLEERHVRQIVGSSLEGSFPRAGTKAAEMVPDQRSIGSRRIPDNQTDHMGSYSWLWWTNGVDREGQRHWPDVPNDVHGAFGHGGIRAMVILPGHDLIISWNNTRIEGKARENRALRMLLDAVRDPALPRPSGSPSPSAGVR